MSTTNNEHHLKREHLLAYTLRLKQPTIICWLLQWALEMTQAKSTYFLVSARRSGIESALAGKVTFKN